MSYPPLPSNGETQWGDKFRTWADALEGRKVEGEGMSLRYDTTVGTRVFLDHPGGSTMVHGDTGWRNVEDSLDPAFTTPPTLGRVLVRRMNNQVFWALRVRFVEPKPMAEPHTLFPLIPVDFRQSPIVYGTVGTGVSALSQTMFAIENVSSGSILSIRGVGTGEWSTDHSLAVSFSYLTTASWPTTLPGTPA